MLTVAEELTSAADDYVNLTSAMRCLPVVTARCVEFHLETAVTKRGDEALARIPGKPGKKCSRRQMSSRGSI